ncbi:hypothetical protein KP509_22G023400 [Ceratopteris richardii]|nr:hypothetical protein KP509_22G023400 [Ceratopteris richardii]
MARDAVAMSMDPVMPSTEAVNAEEQQPRRLAKLPYPTRVLQCPRCTSSDTKFCYYNNHSLSQPRHFCRSCMRYWTAGGTLRNVPIGGGLRKSKRFKLMNPQSLLQAEASAATVRLKNTAQLQQPSVVKPIPNQEAQSHTATIDNSGFLRATSCSTSLATAASTAALFPSQVLAACRLSKPTSASTGSDDDDRFIENCVHANNAQKTALTTSTFVFDQEQRHSSSQNFLSSDGISVHTFRPQYFYKCSTGTAAIPTVPDHLLPECTVEVLPTTDNNSSSHHIDHATIIFGQRCSTPSSLHEKSVEQFAASSVMSTMPSASPDKDSHKRDRRELFVSHGAVGTCKDEGMGFSIWDECQFMPQDFIHGGLSDDLLPLLNSTNWSDMLQFHDLSPCIL